MRTRGIKFDRARYSAITKQEIEHAFSNTVPLDFNLAAAGEARQKIDLVWGAALTRYISLTCGRLGNSFLSVGRVQTPLLALLVDRERDIKSFTPTPYWEMFATLGNGEEFVAGHAGNRFTEKAEGGDGHVQAWQSGTVAEYKKSREGRDPAHTVLHDRIHPGCVEHRLQRRQCHARRRELIRERLDIVPAYG